MDTALPQTTAPEHLATFPFRKVFLSDFHLGSRKTATPYLYEFLKHLDFDALEDIYLVGDIIGGWEHQGSKQRPFPEMERRVLDIINYAAARGIKIHILPGNHDEKMRPLLPLLQNRKSTRTFHENITFANETYYETSGPDKKRLKIVHGDQHDPGLFVKPWFRPITFITSATYDGLVKLNYHLSNVLYRHFGIHVSFAKNLKQSFKSTINFFFSHEALLKGLEGESFDGVLMGHTHMAGVQTFKQGHRTSWLINDGDWVESSTAAYVDDPAELPKIINYKTERENRGFGELPDAADPHPAHFAAFRTQTDRQIRLIHTLWPARNRDRLVKDYRHALIKIAAHDAARTHLCATMQKLMDTNTLDIPGRHCLSAIFADTESGTYRTQKDGLSAIFGKYAAHEPLAGPDMIFARTVIRELTVRSERKIRKHQDALDDAARRLDCRFPPLRHPPAIR